MLDLFISIVKHRTKKTAIKSGELMRKINAMIEPLRLKTKLTEARVRKMSNYLRRNSLLPLCGTTVGYYLSDDPNEISREIQSLRDRANAINAAADGLMLFLSFATSGDISFTQPTQPTPVQGKLFDEQ